MDRETENRLAAIEARQRAIEAWLESVQQREIDREVDLASETMRAEAEEGRNEAERERARDEARRTSDENTRYAAESPRRGQEDARVVAELARQVAERVREETHDLQVRLTEQEALSLEMRRTLARLEGDPAARGGEGRDRE